GTAPSLHPRSVEGRRERDLILRRAHDEVVVHGDRMPNLTLTYLTFRGLGEPIRLMLEDLGVAYEDKRVGGAEWDALKPHMQFRQVPRLQDGPRTLFQCQAILRYLARPRGLCGEDEDERIRNDISVEAVRDLQQRLWDHFWSPGSDS